MAGVGRSSEPPLVLVVDDYDPTRSLYTALLRSAGYRVESAVSGEEAIEKAKRHRPDLFVIDVVLPGMSGWDVVRFLEDNPWTSQRPILVLTGAPEWSREHQEHRAHCDAYLVKPILREKFLQVVYDLLGDRDSGGRRPPIN